VAEAVQAAVRGATSLSCSLGVASTKVVAKVASDRRKPGGLTVVRPGREAAFLAPFDVRLLPGVGPRAEERLRAAEVPTIGDLAALDDAALRRLLPGKVGTMLRDRARGIDPRGLETQVERISISTEETFERDIDDRNQLHAELRRMSARLSDHLIKQGEAARTVTTKVRYPDFSIRSRSSTLAAGSTTATRSATSPALCSTARSPTGRARYALSGRPVEPGAVPPARALVGVRRRDRADEDVEPFDHEIAVELLERSRHQAAVDAADDTRARLGELVERTAAHVDLAPVGLGPEALLLQQAAHLGDRLIVAHPLDRRGTADEVAAPCPAGLLRAALAVGELRDRPGEDRREQPVLVTRRRLRHLRPKDVDHAGPTGLPVRRRARVDEAGVSKQAEMPAHRVLVEREPPRAGQYVKQ
jgi:hypothetical protein